MKNHKELTELGEIEQNLLEILSTMESTYKEYPEYNTIKMGLTSAFKEINAIRIKLVVKEDQVTNKTKALHDGAQN
jgi:hypothetical protein